MAVMTDLLFVLLVAGSLTAVIATVSGPEGRRPGARSGVMVLFFILLLGTWAGGIWMVPLGAPLWGSYWLSFVTVGLVIALILAAVLVPAHHADETPEEHEREERAASGLVLTVILWLLFVALVLAILSGYAML